MNTFIETWNWAAAAWWEWTVTATWQGMVLLGIAALVFVTARRIGPGLRYGLLLVVLLKLALPPLVGLSYGFSDLLAQSLAQERDPTVAPAVVVAPGAPASPSAFVPIALPATAGPAPAMTMSLWGWLLALEVAGALGVLALLGRRQVAEHVLLRGCSGGDADLQERFQRVAEAVGMWRLPRLCVSEGAGAPRSGGILRPYVLLPDWVTALPGDALDSILAHELVHARRKDACWNGLQAVVQALHWWNPAVWWLNRRIREERELCCDDGVLTRGIASGPTYSRALVEVAARVSHPGLAWSAAGMADGYTSIDTRVRRALTGPPPQRRWGRLWAMVLLASVAAWTLPGASDNAPRPEADETATGSGKLDIRNMNFERAERTAAGGTRLSKVSFSLTPGAESALEFQVLADSLLHSQGTSPELLAENARLVLSCGSGDSKALVVSGAALQLSLSGGAAGDVRVEGDMVADLDGATIQAEELRLHLGCSVGFRNATITSSEFDTLRTPLLLVDLETGAYVMRQGQVDSLDVGTPQHLARYRMALNAGSMTGDQKASRVTALEDASISLIDRDDEQARIGLESKHLDFEYPDSADGTLVVDIVGEIVATHDLFSLDARRVRVGEALEFSEVVLRTRDFGEIRSPRLRADLAAKRFDILKPALDTSLLKAAYGENATVTTDEGWLTLPFTVVRQILVEAVMVEVDRDLAVEFPLGTVRFMTPWHAISGVRPELWDKFKGLFRAEVGAGNAEMLGEPAIITTDGQTGVIEILNVVTIRAVEGDIQREVGVGLNVTPTILTRDDGTEYLEVLTEFNCQYLTKSNDIEISEPLSAKGSVEPIDGGSWLLQFQELKNDRVVVVMIRPKLIVPGSK